MKSILFCAAVVLANAGLGFAQLPQHQLASVFGPKIAAQLTFSDSTPVSTGVLNGTNSSPDIAQNSWIEVFGSNLSQTSRTWQASDFVNGQMPISLDNVSATVNGKAAYVWYISSGQVNVLTPLDSALGTVPIQVTTQFGTSAVINATMQQESPGFFAFNGGPYVAALHADYSLLGPTTLYPGLTTPAKPGETILLYANGFGPVVPPVVAGSETQFGNLPVNPVVTVGNLPCQVTFAGLVAPGEFQFNIVVPLNAPDGDNALVATHNGFTTQSGVFLTVQH